MKIVFLSLLILSLVFKCDTYKVLIFNPAYGASHSNFLGKLADILIDAGHNVTMIIPIFEIKKKDLIGSKKVKNIIRIPQDPRIAKVQKEGNSEEILRKQMWKLESDITSLLSFMETFKIASGYQCNNIFKQDDLLKQLTDEHYDLAFSESFFICAFALFERIGVGATMIADSIVFNGQVRNSLGEPASAAYYPDLISNLNDKMTFSQRTKNLLTMIFAENYSRGKNDHELESIEEIYIPTKSAKELLAGVAFNMINSNKFLDFPCPTVPKTVFIGGMQVDTDSGKQLDNQWCEILNLRRTNVLVSFGSMVFSSDMPDDFKSSFLKVFASMPNTTFIWKYEEANATLADHLPNVHLTTWMPQNDLLADDRLTLFVTHGGLGSTMELAYQGKPAVVIPLMADQPRNAHMLTRHGGAFQLDKTHLSDPDAIKKAILTVMEDSKYRENAEKLASILREQPYNPKEVLLKHCDFAVHHGSLETLNSEGRLLNVLVFYSLDVLLFISIVTLLVVYFVYRVCRKVLGIIIEKLITMGDKSIKSE